jgi:hypothetical protein
MIVSLLCTFWVVESPPPFRIHVIDEETKRGVPLVELEALTNRRYHTDSNGLVAITDPVLMNQTAFFYVRSHGYEFKKDGFGIAGARLEVKPGGRAELRIERKNIAERLYRMTGGGIYRHTVALGEKPPIKQPLLNAQVLGSDSVQMTTYKGKLHWFWGDTQRVSYPLGNFNTPGATSLLPANGGLDPDVGVDLEYFVAKDGFAKGAAPMPGPGPTWTTGLVVLHDASGDEQMFAGYAKIRNMLDVYERGLMVWDDAANEFRKVVAFPKDIRAHPTGHTLRCRSKDGDHVYFCDAAPLLRVKAEPKSLADPAGYEVFGCTDPQSDAKNPTIERDSAGRPKYSWRSGRAFGGADGEGKLVKSGLLKPDEVALPLRDPDTGKRFTPHAGSTVWNAYRRKWIMVTTEIFGTSLLGEIWYAEADSPVGPWVYARKILTHDNYSFYNPKLHQVFFKENGRIVYFEGTYTTMFTNNKSPTPDYEYNQIMHRMSLDDPRLNLPTPIYEVENSAPRFVTRNGLRPDSKGKALFCALDRPDDGAVAVYEDLNRRLSVGKAPHRGWGPLFFALPPTAAKRPASAIALHERFDEETKRYVYAVRKGEPVEKDEKLGVRVMFVWENPKADDPAFRAEEVMSYQSDATQ